MRLALSTLGCPELSLSDAAVFASREEYSGLELRSGPRGTIDVTATADDRRRWRAALAAVDVQAVAVASYVKLCDTQVEDAIVVEAGVAEARLAHDLGAPWLRVFPGGTRGVPCAPDVEKRAGRRLAAIAAGTEELGVTVAVETHDSHPTAHDVLRLLDASGCQQVSVIWDALHTWLGGESPEDTSRLLGDRLAYLQVKDVASRDDLAPLALGAGVLPIARCLALIRDADPDGWVSWEYERAWHPEAPSLKDIGVAGREWMTETLTRR